MEQSAGPSNTSGEGLTQDRLEVRIFTLADHAAIAPDGKIYMNGGAVAQVFLREIPGQLPPLWLVVRIRVPFHMTSDQVPLRMRLLDADRRPFGPDPLVEGNPELGRPPGFRPGDESAINVVLDLAGHPVAREGTVYFHLIVADRELSALPLKVVRVPATQAAPSPRV